MLFIINRAINKIKNALINPAPANDYGYGVAVLCMGF
jgi:hypothetical protein